MRIHLNSHLNLNYKEGMIVLIEELERELKEQKLKSIYVLYGEEKFLLESIVKK